MNRICIGQKSGVYGAWISRPGYDVLTCGADGFLMSTDSLIGQFYARGSLSIAVGSTATQTAYFPDAGFTPYPFIVEEITFPGYGAFLSSQVTDLTISLTSTALSVTPKFASSSARQIYYGLLTVAAA